MAIHTLTITFQGICGHYTNVVPGVPHRVVLPDASQVRMGMLNVDCVDLAYYLLPHYVTLESGGEPLDVEGIVKGGYVYRSVLLSVQNACHDQSIDYRNWTKTPRISTFVDNFQFSHEVVLGGRASAYFDIDGGKLCSHQPNLDGPIYTTIEIYTDGVPKLALTPFGSEASPAKTVFREIRDTLTVSNADYDSTDEDKRFDYLLHYLAAERGIPQALRARIPGLWAEGRPPKLELTRIQSALANLGEAIVAGHPSNQIANMSMAVHYESCSDTRYP